MCRVSCRLGQKNPLFPWGFIRSILIEHEVKLECVSVSVNGSVGNNEWKCGGRGEGPEEMNVRSGKCGSDSMLT